MLLPTWKNIESFLHLLGFGSLATFFISIVMIPWLVGRLPHDYFITLPDSRDRTPRRLSYYSVILFVLKNILGFLLLLAGIAMLFLPGQGILTIILGIALMSFPGKHRLLLALTARPSVQRSLDWLRTKTGHQKFIWPS